MLPTLTSRQLSENMAFDLVEPDGLADDARFGRLAEVVAAAAGMKRHGRRLTPADFFPRLGEIGLPARGRATDWRVMKALCEEETGGPLRQAKRAPKKRGR